MNSSDNLLWKAKQTCKIHLGMPTVDCKSPQDLSESVPCNDFMWMRIWHFRGIVESLDSPLLKDVAGPISTMVEKVCIRSWPGTCLHLFVL